MPRALLLIDIQRDYCPAGAYPLVGSDGAADAVRPQCFPGFVNGPSR